MATISGIIRPWARGLFELARSQKQEKNWQDRLAVLSAAVLNKSFYQAVSSRLLDADSVVKLFEKLGTELVDDASLFLVRMLVAKRRLAALPNLLLEFNNLLDLAQGTKNIELISATKMSEQEIKTLIPSIEKIFNSKARVLNSVDPSLLGGVVLKSGDLVLDNSAKRRWERLHTYLKA